MNFARRNWGFALVYVTASIVVEAAMMVIGRLQVPRDNAVLAPIVLTVPPVLAAWIAGCRRWREFAWLAGAAAVFTLLLTIVAGRLTGVSTGLAEPIIVRAVAGFFAAELANRVRGRESRP